MESEPLHAVAAYRRPEVAQVSASPRRDARDDEGFGPLGEPAVEEPLAVIATGPGGAGREAVLAALLGTGTEALRVPAGSFLVVGYDQLAGGLAFLPGYRHPHEYRSEPVGASPALARPPRRVELTLDEPLLRHFTLVDAPDSGTLGRAGTHVLLDAAHRGGALLFVISAEQALAAADLDLLALAGANQVRVFFVVTPGPAGGWSAVTQAERDPGAAGAATPDGSPAPSDGSPAAPGAGPAGPGSPTAEQVGPPEPVAEPVDGVRVTVDAHRAALLAAVPSLTRAPWFALDPTTGDTAYLRQALKDWAADEGLRRASASPPVPPGTTRTVRVRADAAESGWEDRLERQVREYAHRARQDLALELANIHLRCVQEIVFGAGCPGLPGALDREVHGLSLRALRADDAAALRILAETAELVFGEVPEEGVRRRLVAAVRAGFADHRRARDLARVLLVTRTGGVAVVLGEGAVDALAAYRGARRRAVLPGLGIGLSGGCYQHWCNPANADRAKARSWLQRALREIELELAREVGRRFEAVQLSLSAVVTDAIDHGILLA
ncbi:hypothetical protein AB0J86_05880 [Micromonospora sp. NPDC049559]|uniref:hypothetical protein n=1 Tax=Micromonospora sp. NPDC049559 TaxID=3155923 RepID=UPI00341698E9